MRVLFSILRYQLITDEFMNIGILFHNLSTDERKLEIITNWKRVQNFDDEVDINILKIVVEGIKEEIDSNLFNKNYSFDIYEYPIKYVNELRFTTVYEAETPDFEKFIELTRKNILRYDYDKLSRPNKNEQLKIMKELMKSSAIEYSSKQIAGVYQEKVSYDYIIGKYAFKVFTFEEKKIANIISSAKAWAYTAIEMKDKYETVFLYDKDIDNNNNFNSIISILKNSGSKVIKVDEGMEYIMEICNDIKKHYQ